MTVGTDDFAFLDLGEDLLPRTNDQIASDRKLLVTEMVEVEDNRIGFTAVDAGMCPQILDQEAEPVGLKLLLPALVSVKVGRFVGFVMGLAVRSNARTAAGHSERATGLLDAELLKRFR